VAASTAERLARGEADAQKGRAEAALAQAKDEEARTQAALAEAETERRHAQEERDKAQASLDFLTKDVIGAAAPGMVGRDPTMFEILRAAAKRVGERFGSTPSAEISVRSMLSDSSLRARTLPRGRDRDAPLARARRADPALDRRTISAASNRLLGRIADRTGQVREGPDAPRSGG
jgi:hypothetical protein